MVRYAWETKTGVLVVSDVPKSREQCALERAWCAMTYAWRKYAMGQDPLK